MRLQDQPIFKLVSRGAILRVVFIYTLISSCNLDLASAQHIVMPTIGISSIDDIDDQDRANETVVLSCVRQRMRLLGDVRVVAGSEDVEWFGDTEVFYHDMRSEMDTSDDSAMSQEGVERFNRKWNYYLLSFSGFSDRKGIVGNLLVVNGSLLTGEPEEFIYTTVHSAPNAEALCQSLVASFDTRVLEDLRN